MRSTLLLSLSLCVGLMACGDASESAPEAPATSDVSDVSAEAAFPDPPPLAPGMRPAALLLRGVYLGPMYDGDAMLVEHEAIPDRMPAMQMPLRVKVPGLLDGLEVGTAIQMTVDSASLAVIGLTELPEGTVLDLEPDAAEGGDIVLPSE